MKNSTKVSTVVNLHCNIEIQSHRPSSNKEAAMALSPCSGRVLPPPPSQRSTLQIPSPTYIRPTFMPITKYVEWLLVLVSILPPHQSFTHSSYMINSILQAAVIEVSSLEGQRGYKQSPQVAQELTVAPRTVIHLLRKERTEKKMKEWKRENVKYVISKRGKKRKRRN